MKEFKVMMKNKVADKLKGMYNVVATDNLKNNSLESPALVALNESKVDVVIYLEKLLELFDAGKEVEILVDEIMNMIDDYAIDKKMIDPTFGLVKMQGNIGTKLVNSKMNQALLQRIPYVECQTAMYILSNKDLNFGAAFIVCTDILKQVGKELNKNQFYIIQSSIHQVLVIPDLMNIVEKLAPIIQEIDEEVVKKKELLANHVYFVDLEKNSIEIVG